MVCCGYNDAIYLESIFGIFKWILQQNMQIVKICRLLIGSQKESLADAQAVTCANPDKNHLGWLAKTGDVL